MTPNIDILKDFAKLQATIRQLGESNKIFVLENIKLKNKIKNMEEEYLKLAAKENWNKNSDQDNQWSDLGQGEKEEIVRLFILENS